MIIVPVENLQEGMVLARDVSSTSAREFRTLLMKGTELTNEMIDLLKNKGIKSVNILGSAADSGKSGGDFSVSADDVRKQNLSSDRTDAQKENVKNAHISRALNELNNIFDCSEEIRELSQDSVKKVDSIADDILADLGNDASTLGNQMIALQNYDDYTYKHCLRVAMLSTAICTELKLSKDDTKEVIVSALLHDIGKSNIDHDIIIKPGKLTEEEFEEIKRHPLIGYQILKRTGKYEANIMAGVLFHQEKFDGSGYPTKIKGRKIPLIARILTVADVFDALTSNRPYRKPWSIAETEEYILGSCGTHFDYDVTLAFLRAFNPYPIGTVVSLSDDRHGVVIGHNTNVLRPKIRIMGEFGGEEIDLANDFQYLSVMVKGIYTGDYTK